MSLRIVKISDQTTIQVYDGTTQVSRETFTPTNLRLINDRNLEIKGFGGFVFADFDLTNSDMVLQTATNVRQLRDLLLNNDYFV